jgi:mRNA interferase YafQ
MLNLSYTNKFKKEVRLAALRGRDIMKMFPPIFLLLDGQTLPKQYNNHPIHGKWEGYNDFHIEPDWIVIYCIKGNTLILARTGTHSELFD